jgi:hypothetical protein
MPLFRRYKKLHRELYSDWQQEWIPHLGQVIMYTNNATYDLKRRDEECERVEAMPNTEQKTRERRGAFRATAAGTIEKMFADKIEGAVVDAAVGGGGLTESTSRFSLAARAFSREMEGRHTFDGTKYMTRKQAFCIAQNCARNYTVHRTLKTINCGMFGRFEPLMRARLY